MRDRAILHIDMNAFYASVAQHLDPSLRGKAVAVAGDPERRSGIILAKSRQAKAAGVKTAEAIWQAKQKCPDLIVVPRTTPPTSATPGSLAFSTTSTPTRWSPSGWTSHGLT